MILELHDHATHLPDMDALVGGSGTFVSVDQLAQLTRLVETLDHVLVIESAAEGLIRYRALPARFGISSRGTITYNP